MELAETMVAALLGRVTGPGVHLLKPPEPGVEGGQLVQISDPTDHCQPWAVLVTASAQFPRALPNLL